MRGSFKRSTTAEDGDMALAMALDQAETQNVTDPAPQRTEFGDPLSALRLSNGQDSAQMYHNPGKTRTFTVLLMRCVVFKICSCWFQLPIYGRPLLNLHPGLTRMTIFNVLSAND